VKELIFNKKFQLFFSGNGNFQIRYNTLRRSTGPTIDAIRAIPHERYNPQTVDNDIAILILSSRFQNGINARAIRILPNSDPNPGSTVTVSGWGHTSLPPNGNPSENLQIANLNVVQRSICRILWFGYITSNVICASYSTRSTCIVSIAQ
jgi:trypsin